MNQFACLWTFHIPDKVLSDVSFLVRRHLPHSSAQHFPRIAQHQRDDLIKKNRQNGGTGKSVHPVISRPSPGREDKARDTKLK